MTPTMEEVAGWLEEAALSERATSLACATGVLPRRFKGEADERADLFDSRAAQVEAMGWRPIGEAPKNKRMVDLWEADSGARIPDCTWLCNAWHQYRYEDGWAEVTCGTITHFMPPPAPPVAK